MGVILRTFYITSERSGAVTLGDDGTREPLVCCHAVCNKLTLDGVALYSIVVCSGSFFKLKISIFSPILFSNNYFEFLCMWWW